jgi:hypothetical protein
LRQLDDEQEGSLLTRSSVKVNIITIQASDFSGQMCVSGGDRILIKGKATYRSSAIFGLRDEVESIAAIMWESRVCMVMDSGER